MIMLNGKFTLVFMNFVVAMTCFGRDVSVTPPAGYFGLSVGGLSDTNLSVPLVRRSAAMGTVTRVTANQVGVDFAVGIAAISDSLSVAGAYYVEFVTGNLAGLAYPIIGNGTGGLTLETKGDDLTAHALGVVVTGASGDIVRIRPAWTADGLFSQGGSLLLDPSPAFTGPVYHSGDAVLFPDNESVGTEKPAAVTLAYITNQGWRRRNGDDVDVRNYPFYPWNTFIVRRGGNVVELLVVGYVPVGVQVLRLPSLPEGAEMDFAVPWMHASSKPIMWSGLSSVLNSSAGRFSATDLFLDYVPDWRIGGFNPLPECVLGLVDGVWMKGDVVDGYFTLRRGVGYVLRLRGERPARYWRQDDAY